MSQKYNVAVLGATGLVGRQIIETLADRKFPVDQLFLLASSRSAGEDIKFRGETIEVLDVEGFDFSQAHIGLFSAGGSVSEKYAPIAAEAGCIVIDNTSHFRNDFEIPLVVPEVNASSLADFRNRNIIANPNCSTIQMMLALKPIYDAYGIDRINVSTYQAVSGAGKEAVDELAKQTANLMNARPMDNKVFPKQIAFNVIPQIDSFEDNGYTREEMKMVNETHKIFNDSSIGITATAIRIPVVGGHSESVNLEFENSFEINEIRSILEQTRGVEVQDNPKENIYPMPIEAKGKDSVFVLSLIHI